MLTEGNVVQARPGKVDTRVLDRVIADLAVRQHGVVSRTQLVAAGAHRSAIEHRLGCGRLHAVHRGVYAVGHLALKRDGRWMAAVLACGPGAVLSHRSAAALWAILPSKRTAIEVTVPQRRRAPEGVDPHRSRIEPDEITIVAGIPITTVARTLLDLAAVETQDRLERALNEAERRNLADDPSLTDLIRRYGPRAGRAKLRNATPDVTVTRSQLERDFLRFLDRHGLPRPETNAVVEGYEVDCLWRRERLIVELDGYAFHATRHAFDHDRERDRRLQAAGHRTVRITAAHLSAETAADLRALTGA